MFKIYDGRTEFYQWDLDQKLIVENEEIKEVHFANWTDSNALICEPYSLNGVRVVDVPNILLQQDWTLFVWATANEATIGEAKFNIIARKKPSDYIYTETEVKRWEDIVNSVEELSTRVNEAYSKTWFVDTDKVVDGSGKTLGTLQQCMNDDYIGSWFFVKTTNSEAGSYKYPEAYNIDGTNGYINLRDYVVWTGAHLVHISNFEAKASTVKNTDGKYSPKSGVDGRMSSTDKAYLTDLINAYWGKDKLPLFPNPEPAEGWQCNWCRDTGIYLGGIKKDCGGHPPVVNDNHTSWVLMVFNGMATDANSLNHNHRLQIAFDLVNSKIYMRRGWMSSNTFADWTEVGGMSEIADTIDTLTHKNGAGYIDNADISYTEYEIGNYKNIYITFDEPGNGVKLILPNPEEKPIVRFTLKYTRVSDTSVSVVFSSTNKETVRNFGGVNMVYDCVFVFDGLDWLDYSQELIKN